MPATPNGTAAAQIQHLEFESCLPAFEDDTPPMPYDADLAQAVLDRNNLKAERVAERCNINSGTVSRMLRGQHALSLAVARCIYDMTRDAQWLDHLTGGAHAVIPSALPEAIDDRRTVDACSANAMERLTMVVRDGARRVNGDRVDPLAAIDRIDSALAELYALRTKLLAERQTQQPTGSVIDTAA